MVDCGTASSQGSLPMNGGNGTYSYSRNSSVQRDASMTTKATMEEVIAAKFDIEYFSTTSKIIRIADFGCSVGPNTFIAMQHIMEAMQKKCHLKGINGSELPEFQVFFNDQATNDFNTLFTSLPREKHYFVAGVPGSFHGQLFPTSSLHFVYSSFAFHWFSEVPKEILRKDSPAWNKGNIFYTSASDEVAKAYANQFAKDIGSILNARAKEIVPGGMMIILLPAVQDDYHRSKISIGFMLGALGCSLTEMADEGLITAAQVDTFNLPLYITSPKEMAGLIGNSGLFSIERMKLVDAETEMKGPIDTSKHVTHIRAAMEGLISAHFGDEIIDELFDRFDKKAVVYKHLDVMYRKGVLLFLALKRK